jgi:glycosyltransferase involved in cell wall biosynthesis
MVADQNRPFIVGKDASALGLAMGLLLKDAQLVRRVGEANRARAEREFDEETMFARYDQLFSGQT